MKKLSLLVAVVLGVFGCKPTRGPEPLVVGMALNYPPFETIDESGQPVGVSVEIAQALAEYLGRPLKIENMPFVGLIPALQAGRIDCVISSMTRTEERAQSIDFSDPYLKTGLGMLVGKDSGLEGIEDAPGRTYVVCLGTTGEVWARNRLKEATVMPVDRENSAVLEVVQGKADGFIYDQMSVWTNWRNHQETTKPILKPIQVEEWAIGIRKGEDELRGQINAFLGKFREEGGFDRLAEKYLADQKKAFEVEGVPFVF